MPLFDWAPGDYIAQWLDAAERLVAGEPAVVFVTHMVHPTADYHMGWPAWRDGDRVLVQERLFLAEQLGGPFDVRASRADTSAPGRTCRTRGCAFPSGTVTLSDVAAFVDRRRRSSVPA